jgi:hypothetical protein
MLDKKLKSDVIEAYVKLFEDYAETSDIEKVYDDTVKYAQRIDLDDITEEDVENVIKPFLYKWGNMGRVLGRQEYKGWEKKLKDLIKEYSSMLGNFRKESLAKIEQFEREIKEIYSKFRETLGPIAAGKTLNILCPNFFPLWDSAIRNAFSQAFDLKDDDYYTFMLKVRNFIKEYEETFSKLANKYNKNMLRIFDEFSWQITHDPISLFPNVFAISSVSNV